MYLVFFIFFFFFKLAKSTGDYSIPISFVVVLFLFMTLITSLGLLCNYMDVKNKNVRNTRLYPHVSSGMMKAWTM